MTTLAVKKHFFNNFTQELIWRKKYGGQYRYIYMSEFNFYTRCLATFIKHCLSLIKYWGIVWFVYSILTISPNAKVRHFISSIFYVHIFLGKNSLINVFFLMSVTFSFLWSSRDSVASSWNPSWIWRNNNEMLYCV